MCSPPYCDCYNILNSCSDLSYHSFFSDWPDILFIFCLALCLSLFPSASLHQYGKADEMSITLAQSLGQNIGIFSDKKKILNGTKFNLNESFNYYFSSTHPFFQDSFPSNKNMSRVSYSRRVQVWWSLDGLYHGWCWVSYFYRTFVVLKSWL